MKKQIKGNGFFVVLLLLVVVSIYMANGMGKKNTIKYNTSDMVRDIGSGKVKNIEISQNQNTPTGRVDITFNDTSKVYYYSTDVSEVENRLYELSEDPEYKGTFTYITNQVEKTPWWITMLPDLLLVLLLIVVMFMMTVSYTHLTLPTKA